MRHLGFVLLLGLTHNAEAADWATMLKADVVSTADAKMVIQSYSLCTVNDPAATKKSFQVGGHTEQPLNGPMSRDNFVAFDSAARTTASYKLGTKLVPAGTNPMSAFKCSPLSAPIGTVDFELNFFMTNDGVQVEVKDNNAQTVKREVLPWASVFPN